MKRFLIFLIPFLLLVGCSDKEETTIYQDTTEHTEIVSEGKGLVGDMPIPEDAKERGRVYNSLKENETMD